MAGAKKKKAKYVKSADACVTGPERDALRKMTVEEKFRQVSALFDPRPPTPQELAEIEEVRARWKRLQDHYASSQDKG